MIQDYRKQSILNTKLNHNGEIMTRLEFLTKMKANGATVEEKQVRNYAAEEKLETWTEELKAGIFKTVYYLHPSKDGSFYQITKTEYDKFLEL